MRGLRKASPGGVLEGVLIVESDEESEDGQKHDRIAHDYQNGGAPVNLKRRIKSLNHFLYKFIFKEENRNKPALR